MRYILTEMEICSKLFLDKQINSEIWHHLFSLDIKQLFIENIYNCGVFNKVHISFLFLLLVSVFLVCFDFKI